MSWLVTYCADLVPRQVHVTPAYDGYTHEMTLTCSCKPTLEQVDESWLVIHREMN